MKFNVRVVPKAAFRSAKVASARVSFAERKATVGAEVDDGSTTYVSATKSREDSLNSTNQPNRAIMLLSNRWRTLISSVLIASGCAIVFAAMQSSTGSVSVSVIDKDALLSVTPAEKHRIPVLATNNTASTVVIVGRHQC